MSFPFLFLETIFALHILFFKNSNIFIKISVFVASYIINKLHIPVNSLDSSAELCQECTPEMFSVS